MTNYYSMVEYDVWGNSKDGFEVNNAYVTEKDIVLSDDCLKSNKALIAALKRLGFIKRGTHSKSISIEGESEYTLYFSDVRRVAGGYYPIFELRRQDGNSQGE